MCPQEGSALPRFSCSFEPLELGLLRYAPDIIACSNTEKLGKQKMFYPSTSMIASRNLAMISSASLCVRQKGGANPKISPSGIARLITPRLSKAAFTFAPIIALGSKNTRSLRSATNSTAPSNPSPRISPTCLCAPLSGHFRLSLNHPVSLDSPRRLARCAWGA